MTQGLFHVPVALLYVSGMSVQLLCPFFNQIICSIYLVTNVLIFGVQLYEFSCKFWILAPFLMYYL